MNIIFFDTETIGFPINWKAPVTEVDNWPRMMQLGFEVCNDKGEVLQSYLKLVKPDGWEVPNERFWIENGYSNERSLELGEPVSDVLSAFVNAIEKYDCQLLVAHNMDFDKNVVGAEMIRLDIKIERRMLKVCTMKSSVDLCQLPGKFGLKFPKLVELYNKLFDKDFDGAHDAGNDVAACRECFFKLVELGIMKLPEIKEVQP